MLERAKADPAQPLFGCRPAEIVFESAIQARNCLDSVESGDRFDHTRQQPFLAKAKQGFKCSFVVPIPKMTGGGVPNCILGERELSIGGAVRRFQVFRQDISCTEPGKGLRRPHSGLWDAYNPAVQEEASQGRNGVRSASNQLIDCRLAVDQ